MGAQDQGANAVQGRWMTIPRTLIFIFNGDDVLLMKRAPHKRVFPNRYNGVGGHVERDEDVWTSARREIKEETGLDVLDLKLCAVSNIDAGAETGIVLFTFTAQSASREVLIDGDEGTLHWIPLADLERYDLVEDVLFILRRLVDMTIESPPLFYHVSYNDEDQIVMKARGD